MQAAARLTVTSAAMGVHQCAGTASMRPTEVGNAPVGGHERWQTFRLGHTSFMTAVGTRVRAATYSRISDDRQGRALGVERQRADTVDVVATREDWVLVEQYEDNDVSASRFARRRRAAFARLNGDIAAHTVQVVVCWDLDRLVRQPSELEALISLSAATGFRLFDVRGEIDLRSANGRFQARILGGVAAHESDHKSERITRQVEQAAQLGRPHGRRPYGWRRIRQLNRSGVVTDWQDEIDPDETDIVRELARRILSGESLRTIASDLNARHLPSREGGLWTPTSVRTIAGRWRNCGLRVHHGEPAFQGDWPPILDRMTVDAVRGVLSDPSRRSEKRNHGRRTHLLTGLSAARCAECDDMLRVEHVHGRYSLRCRRGCVSRREEWVDEFVCRLIVERLSQADATELMRSSQDDDSSRAATEAEHLRAKLSQTADDYAADLIDRATYLRTIARTRERLTLAEQKAAVRRRPAVLAGLVDTSDVVGTWNELDLDRKRAVIDVLLILRLLPAGRGNRRLQFDPDSVHIEWRQD
jgi:site-specific DNA recombinase